jgi:hypothetical protein
LALETLPFLLKLAELGRGESAANFLLISEAYRYDWSILVLNQ